MITRNELNRIKELSKFKTNGTLLEVIQSAEEFGAIDGRKERQEANTIALRKVLTDCGLEVKGMGFGDMLYELRKAMKDRGDEMLKEPKVLDADGIEIKPGDELYLRDEIPSLDGTFTGVVRSVHADNCPNPLKGNKPWVRYKTGGWDLAEVLTHQKSETLQDVIDDLYKQVPYQEFGHIIRVPIDLIDRLEAIDKRMGGNQPC